MAPESNILSQTLTKTRGEPPPALPWPDVSPAVTPTVKLADLNTTTTNKLKGPRRIGMGGLEKAVLAGVGLRSGLREAQVHHEGGASGKPEADPNP